MATLHRAKAAAATRAPPSSSGRFETRVSPQREAAPAALAARAGRAQPPARRPSARSCHVLAPRSRAPPAGPAPRRPRPHVGLRPRALPAGASPLGGRGGAGLGWAVGGKGRAGQWVQGMRVSEGGGDLGVPGCRGSPSVFLCQVPPAMEAPPEPFAQIKGAARSPEGARQEDTGAGISRVGLGHQDGEGAGAGVASPAQVLLRGGEGLAWAAPAGEAGKHLLVLQTVHLQAGEEDEEAEEKEAEPQGGVRVVMQDEAPVVVVGEGVGAQQDVPPGVAISLQDGIYTFHDMELMQISVLQDAAPGKSKESKSTEKFADVLLIKVEIHDQTTSLGLLSEQDDAV